MVCNTFSESEQCGLFINVIANASAGIDRGPRPRFAAGDVIFVSPAPGKPYVTAGDCPRSTAPVGAEDRPGIVPGLRPRWEPGIDREIAQIMKNEVFTFRRQSRES